MDLGSIQKKLLVEIDTVHIRIQRSFLAGLVQKLEERDGQSHPFVDMFSSSLIQKILFSKYIYLFKIRSIRTGICIQYPFREKS